MIVLWNITKNGYCVCFRSWQFNVIEGFTADVSCVHIRSAFGGRIGNVSNTVEKNNAMEIIGDNAIFMKEI